MKHTTIIGTVVSSPTPYYTVDGESFYTVNVKTGEITVPVLISKVQLPKEGSRIKAEGFITSTKDTQDDGSYQIYYYVHAYTVTEASADEEDMTDIHASGKISSMRGPIFTAAGKTVEFFYTRCLDPFGGMFVMKCVAIDAKARELISKPYLGSKVEISGTLYEYSNRIELNVTEVTLV